MRFHSSPDGMELYILVEKDARKVYYALIFQELKLSWPVCRGLMKLGLSNEVFVFCFVCLQTPAHYGHVWVCIFKHHSNKKKRKDGAEYCCVKGTFAAKLYISLQGSDV